MIPYLQITNISIGPVPIHVWGLLVALGIICGLAVAAHEAKRRKLSVEVLLDIAFWTIVAALIGARVFFVLTEFSRYLEAPLDVVKVWEGGMSITGGFIGAVLMGWFYMKKRQVSFLEYTDVAIFGLPVGLWIGRIGCLLIFDHPGTQTNFFLGQEYIDGIVRHNHGLYLSLNGLAMAIAFFILRAINPHRPAGFYPVVFLIWYGVVRIVLDFFRAYYINGFTDARFLSLTGAQYVGLGAIVLGGWLWYRVKHQMTDSTHHASKTT